MKILLAAISRPGRLEAVARGIARPRQGRTKEKYDKVGGLTSVIEDAAEGAMRGLEPEGTCDVLVSTAR